MKLRDEEIIWREAMCMCGWTGPAEIFEGLFAYPCPHCGAELPNV